MGADVSVWRRCYYCGAQGAKIREPGEPATCRQCGDLPKAESRVQLNIEIELQRHYNGENVDRG